MAAGAVVLGGPWITPVPVPGMRRRIAATVPTTLVVTIVALCGVAAALAGLPATSKPDPTALTAATAASPAPTAPAASVTSAPAATPTSGALVTTSTRPPIEAAPAAAVPGLCQAELAGGLGQGGAGVPTARERLARSAGVLAPNGAIDTGALDAWCRTQVVTVAPDGRDGSDSVGDAPDTKPETPHQKTPPAGGQGRPDGGGPRGHDGAGD